MSAGRKQEKGKVPPRGIILDGTFGTKDAFANVFLRIAHNEGYTNKDREEERIERWLNRENFWDSRREGLRKLLEEKLLESRQSAYLPVSGDAKRKCLELALLYGKVYLHNCHASDDWGIERLRSYDLAEFIDCSFSRDYLSEVKVGPSFKTCEDTVSFVPPRQRRIGHGAFSISTTERDLAFFLQSFILSEIDHVLSGAVTKDLSSLSKVNTDNFADYTNALYLGNVTAQFWNVARMLSAIAVGREPGPDDYSLEIPERHRKLLDMFEDAEDFNVLANLAGFLRGVLSALEKSQDWLMPILIRQPSADYVSHITTRSLFDGDIEILRPDTYWRAYQIYLDEVTILPKLDTLEDVLRLREDQRIERFRNALFKWSLAFREGDAKAEKEMRNEIRATNRELAKVAQCRRIGKWVTYMTVPLTIISALTASPIGLALLPISVGVRVYSDIKEWENRWLLIGR